MDRHQGRGAEREGKSEPGGCAAFEPLLEAYYHHALPPDQERAVAVHAAGCARCTATLADFAETDRLIATALTSPPGPELRRRLMARIAAASMPFKRDTVVNDANDMHEIGDQRESSDMPWTIPDAPARGSGKGMQRLRLLLGTLAAALIVALLAGMFVLQTRGTHNQVNTGHGNGPAAPGACTPANITAHPPANTFLADLDMISPTEGWAVGYIRDAQNYGPVNTLIMRYHNCSWAPVATNYPNATLLSVSMVSATEGWAVGGTGDGHPLALHYTGGKWRQTRLPGEDGLSGVYSAIHIRSADEGWLVVQHAKDARGELSESLLHLVGGRWSTVKAPFAMFNDVLPVAPNEAWMAGYVADGQQQPVLYHYHGGSWTSVTLPRGVVVDRLRMVSPNDIWASGHINAPSNVDYQATAAALHFDGSGWRVVNSGASGHPQFVQAFDANTSLAFTLSQASAHEQLDVIGAVQYERGGKWMTVAWPFQNMGLGFVALGLNPIQRVSGDEYWTIGWIQPSNGAAQPVLLYFTSGVWHAYGAN